MKLRQTKKLLKKTWLWTRIRQVRFRRWWFRNDTKYGLWWRVGNGAAAVLMLVAVVIPVLQQWSSDNSYKLSADTLKLVGSTDPTLSKQLTYDASTQTYQFNKDAIKSATDGTNPLANMESQVGTASGNSKNKSLYALDVPRTISKGVTYHDVNSGLSFSLVPQFTASQGQEVQGHLVFPLSGDSQAIYTLKNNGLKEDIVVQKPTQSAMTFSYKLDLPSTLQAKIIPGSDGAIGIYSADPTLFGDISYGSDADRAAVQKARENGAKTYLVFGLPSPVIKTPDGNSVGNARFQLDGNNLSVVASGLSGITTPVTIDPSVVVTSTSDFQAGNNESNIDFGTADQVTRGGLTGGSLGSWSSGTSFDTARGYAMSATYNGYIYIAGGTNGAFSTRYSDVQFAALNSSTGAIGSWKYTNNSTSQTSPSLGGFTTARFGAGMVAYDGYLYVIGGNKSTCTSTSANCLNDVQYAPLNSDGTVGTWQTTTSFTTAREGLMATAYNGYLYIAGGDNQSGALSDVQYAPIKADGTIGTWASGGTFGTARAVGGLVAYNNYLYVVGGEASNTPTGTVNYVPINSDGSLGTWGSTTTLSSARAESAFSVQNGYMYVAGGYQSTPSSGPQNDSYYASINANGTLGTWAASTTLNTPREGATGVSYNGYTYILGGYNDSTTVYATTELAKVNPAGTTGAYNTTTSITSPSITAGAVIAYANHIYMIGGYNGGTSTLNSSYVTTVKSDTLAADGTLGATWSTGTTLVHGVSETGVTIYNGFIYIVGGFDGTNDGTGFGTWVQFAPISATGTIGTWHYTHSSTDDGTTFVSGFPNDAGNHIPVAYNGFLYFRGLNGGATNNNYYAPINSNGTVGTWTSTSVLAAPTNSSRNFEQQVAYNGYMYVVGGKTTGGADLADIEYSLICTGSNTADGCSGQAAGSLGNWLYTYNSTSNSTSTNALITARERFNADIINGYLYVAGGISGASDTATAESAPINADGTIGTFSSSPALPLTVSQGQGTSYNGYVYSVSGKINGTRATTSYYAYMNNGGSGVNGSWSAASGTISSSRYMTGVAAYNGYIYVVGGYDSTTLYNDVEYAPLSATGGIGSFSTDPNSFTTTRQDAKVAAYNGYLYIIGGAPNNYSTEYNDVQYAPIGSSGALTAGFQTVNFDTSGNGRAGVCTVANNGYLYILGGHVSAGFTNTTRYAPIGSNGVPGTWSSSSSFATARTQAGCFAYDGYMYLVGGANASVPFNDVQVAPINSSNGSLGTWVTTANFNVARGNAEVGAANGFAYIVGGCTDTNGDCDGGRTNVVEYAAIGTNGQVGTWQIGTPFTTARGAGGGAIYDGYIYAVTGYTSSGFTNGSIYAPLNAISRSGQYSKLIDLGAAMNVTSITYNSASGSSLPASAITYRAAGSNGVFGSSALASSASGAGGCLGTTTNTRYVWVSVTLDDSYGMNDGGLFPDIAGVTSSSGVLNANLTDFTINYTTTHPTPSTRLRGGQTLQTGNVSGLDTCSP